MTDVGDELVERGLVLRHEPADDEQGRPVVAGHIHPAVWLHGFGMRSERLPCFYLSENQAVLPAFGAFTGMHAIRPRVGDRVFALGPDGVFEVAMR